MNTATTQSVYDDRDIHDLMSPIATTSPDYVPFSAWHEHAPFAFWIVDALRPASFVELGTHNGFSYLAFCQLIQRLKLPTRAYAVDTWEGDDHASFYGEEVFQTLQPIHDAKYAAFSRLLRMRFDEALPSFPDGSVDLLHIDGRHGYEDVSTDFYSWLPKMSSRGVVLFHDTNVRERDFGVWRLWSEVKDKYPGFEFLHGHGLGVLCVGADVPATVLKLTQLAEVQVTTVRSYYWNLGAQIALIYLLRNTEKDLWRRFGEANARIASLEAAHSAAQDRLKDSLQQLDAERRQGAQSMAELSRYKDRAQQLEQQMAQSESTCREASALLHEMQSARSWKLAMRFQKLYLRLPLPLRRMLGKR